MRRCPWEPSGARPRARACHAGCWARDLRLRMGVGGGGRGCPALRCPRRLHPRACSFGVGYAACRTGLPGSTRVCLVLLLEPEASWESSCFLRASRPRGIPADHTWPELRPGTGLTQSSGLWVAPGSPTCLCACRVESGNSSCCCPWQALGRWATLIAVVLVSGFGENVRPDLELRTPFSTHFQAFSCRSVLSRDQLSFSVF